MPKATNEGGKRAGSGAKQGTAAQKTEDTVLVPFIAGYIAQLPPREQSVIRFRAQGRSQAWIAEKLTMDERTVCAVEHRNPEAIDEAVRDLVDPQAIFNPMVPKAAEVYDSLVDLGLNEEGVLKTNADWQTRLRAAENIMDRKYGRPVIRQQTEVRERITIVFEDRD